MLIKHWAERDEHLDNGVDGPHFPSAVDLRDGKTVGFLGKREPAAFRVTMSELRGPTSDGLF